MRLCFRSRRLPRALSLRIVIGAAAVLGGALPSVARADDAAATAQALFDEATALKDKEQWKAACPKFASSYKLDPALGTLLNLANCYEKVGSIASAWARWEEAYQWAIKNNDDRAEYAKKNRDAIAPRLPHLKITVKNPVAALSIESDTVKVTEPMYGTALPVDPGEHLVFVKRGDELLKTEKVSVVEAQTAEITLDLAAIEKAAPPPKPKGNVVVVGVSPALRKVGWAVGATGVAGAIAAGAIEIVALGKKAQADLPQNCSGKYCSPAGIALVRDARTLAEAGQWVGIASLAVVAVGVTLLIVTPSQVVVNDAPGKEKKDASVRHDVWASPWISPETGSNGDARAPSFGLAIGGRL